MFVVLNVEIVSVLSGGRGLAQHASAQDQVFMCFLQWQQLAGEKYLDSNKSKARQLVLNLRGDVLLFLF